REQGRTRHGSKSTDPARSRERKRQRGRGIRRALSGARSMVVRAGLWVAVGRAGAGAVVGLEHRHTGGVLALHEAAGDHEVGAREVAPEDLAAEAVLFDQALVRVGERRPELGLAQVEDALEEAAAARLRERVVALAAEGGR